MNDKNLVAMIMWLLWCRRQRLLHDGKGKAFDLLVQTCTPSRAVNTIHLVSAKNGTCYFAPTGACIKVNESSKTGDSLSIS